MLFPKTIDRETIGDFIFTLDGHNFNQISKLVQPKLADQPVSKSYSLRHLVVEPHLTSIDPCSSFWKVSQRQVILFLVQALRIQ